MTIGYQKLNHFKKTFLFQDYYSNPPQKNIITHYIIFWFKKSQLKAFIPSPISSWIDSNQQIIFPQKEFTYVIKNFETYNKNKIFLIILKETVTNNEISIIIMKLYYFKLNNHFTL